MSGPPPPPPSAPPPPLPNFSAPSKGSGGGDGRSALLKSIQKGTTLKKAVTNDRSAPAVSGKSSNNNNNSNSIGTSPGLHSNSNSGSHAPPMANGFAGLGGLFADGMPKLRPTGKLSNLDNNSSAPRPIKPAVARNNSNHVPQGPLKNVGNIQDKLKRQLANNDNRNRGPPPPAPSRNLSDEGGLNTRINGTNMNHHLNNHTLVKNISSLHQSKSNTNLSSHDYPDSTFNGIHQQLKPVISHGKPNLAPKPPSNTGTLPNKPRKLSINGGQVNRAHSLRSPRSPSPTHPRPPEPLPGLVSRNRSTNARPPGPPPSVPSHFSYNHQTSGAPPPPKSMNVKPPNHAPPPPPSALPQVPQSAPPPPPHRMRPPPAVPTHNPPPPPPRLSSMSRSTDLDEVFKDKFRPPSEFPAPPPFTRIRKEYLNKQVVSKQQAPQPPTLPSRNWNTTSSC